jgi:hypothetical protein
LFLLVFGSAARQSSLFVDLCCFAELLYAYVPPIKAPFPEARTRHTSAFYRGKLVVFGGLTALTNNEINILDVHNWEWHSPLQVECTSWVGV